MVEINTEDQIKMLVELQEIDNEMYNKKRVLEAVPERIKELDAAVQVKSANLKNLEEESKKLQVKRKEKEVELQTKEETTKKYQAQLFQIKTNKEYAALEKEIAGIKADNSVLEEEIIILLDETDEIQKKISKEREIFEGEKKKAREEKTKLQDEKKTNEAEYNDLNNKRKEFVTGIDKKILAKYERILKKWDGLAMVPVVSGTCGGCNMNLPPQVINEAELRKDLIFCGNCSRILYSKE
ncbi:MAG: hypothetical protein ISS90_00525 [Candidatus Omnitrophica bacterium]|nr:hypothetical protein [Candidatus Omnitrophota bacterium]